MQVSRRRFLGATSGAATLSALSGQTRAQAPADPAADPLARSRVRVAVSLFNNAADIQRLLDVAETLRA